MRRFFCFDQSAQFLRRVKSQEAVAPSGRARSALTLVPGPGGAHVQSSPRHPAGFLAEQFGAQLQLLAQLRQDFWQYRRAFRFHRVQRLRIKP